LWFIDAGSVTFVDKPISSRYLTQDDRIEIADGLAAGEPVKSIAARIGKSYQTGRLLCVLLHKAILGRSGSAVGETDPSACTALSVPGSATEYFDRGGRPMTKGHFGWAMTCCA
jgi:hypothetical protein